MNRRQLIELATLAIAGAATASFDSFISSPALPILIPFKFGKWHKTASGCDVEVIVDMDAFDTGMMQLQAAIKRGDITEHQAMEMLSKDQLFEVVHVK